jgi:hypothetical protein
MLEILTMGGVGAILFGLGLRVFAKALPSRPPKPRAADFGLSTGIGYLEYQKDYNASQGRPPKSSCTATSRTTFAGTGAESQGQPFSRCSACEIRSP